MQLSFFDIKLVRKNTVKYSTSNLFCSVMTGLWDSYWKWHFTWHILFTFRNSGSTGRWAARNAAAEIALCKPVSLYPSRNSWQPSVNYIDSHTWRFLLHIHLLMMWIWNGASCQLPVTLKRLKSFNCWIRAMA